MPRFEITIIEAQGLPAADLNGKSDPYIVVCSATEKQKTAVKEKTLNPVWNEIKTVSMNDPVNDAIGFLVFDKDSVSADNIIAYSFISMVGVPFNGAPIETWVDIFKKTKKDKKKDKKKKKKAAGPPKPGTPGGRLHLRVRALDAPPMPAGAPMPMPGQPMPGQPYPAQPMPGQPMPGQPMPGQPMMMPGQPMPGQPMPGQPMMMPGQPMMAPPVMAGPPPLVIQNPYKGTIPQGFQNKSGFLRPKMTDGEAAEKAIGKGAKKTLKFLGKLLG